MTWMEAKAAALDMLRNAYNREIERIAEELRPRLESRELRGFTDEDCEHEDGWRAPREVLEREVGGRIARTREEALLVLAVSRSPHTPGMKTEGAAAETASVDVLRVAFARGWYRPEPDESPSAATLTASEPMAEVRS
jgi:hypothetical protein